MAVSNSQKHVNFASPPAVPISPASYPSSPESTRQSPGFQHVQPHTSETSNYGQALYHDPFQEDAIQNEDDRAIEQALRNARLNNAMPAGSNAATTAKQANIRDTLSRFASAPRQPNLKTEESSKKPAMDVNAFTRMLLTGQSGTAGAGQSVAAQPVNDSSSSTDTASTSQRSFLESGARTAEETSQSSSETERDHEAQRVSREVKKRPPPPKPRHGRPVSEVEALTAEPAEADTRRTSTTQPEAEIQRTMSEDSDAPTPPTSSDAKASRKPPPPPLARRKSQKQAPPRPEITRSSSSRYSLSSDNEDPLATPPPSGRMPPPPPPPSRRPNSQYGRRPSTDLPSTYEQDEDDSDAAVTDRPTSSSKQMSQVLQGQPPPLPPPRKNKSSGRSSVDSQHRPSMAALGLTGGSTRSSSELSRPTGEGSNAPTAAAVAAATGPNAADILADLEALRREVDAARASAGR